jgi:hypothetical protein
MEMETNKGVERGIVREREEKRERDKNKGV